MEEILGKANEAFVIGVAVYIVRGWIANKVMKQGRKLISKSERNSAIFQHYQKQARNEGHASASPIGCGQDRCRVFGSVPQVA